MASPTAIDRVRAELDRALSPDDSARALLSALTSWAAQEPRTQGELAKFLDGPLSSALERMFSFERAVALVEALHDVLRIGAGDALGDAADVEEGSRPSRELHNRITGRIPLARHRPVPVVVVAGNDALANRLQVLATPDRAVLTATHSLEEIERATANIPLVAVLDACDPTSVPAEVVVSALSRTPQHVQWIVWGVGRAYGRELAMLAELCGRAVISLREEDGVGPMVDVILSRRA